MDKKQRIQELLHKLDDLEARNPQASIARLLKEEEAKTRANIGDSPTASALKVLARGITNVQNDKRPDELASQLSKNQEENKTNVDELSNSFAEQVANLLQEIKDTEARGMKLTKDETSSIIERFYTYENDFTDKTSEFASKNAALEQNLQRLAAEMPGIYSRIEAVAASTPSIEVHSSDLDALKAELLQSQDTSLQGIRQDLTDRISKFPLHGGNMNRNVAIGGNTSVLSRYTDINLKAGANVQISYSFNDATKYTDVTIAATSGGGGSVTGIIRSVNNVATNTNAGAVAGTDYVYLVGATANIVLPTSVGNNNLYTVKNVGAGTVTILPTGAETIDGTANITMPIQYTSVDLISNNSGNWNIT